MVSWTKPQLPTPTNDLDKVANDIDQWGYGLLEDALSAPLLTKTRGRKNSGESLPHSSVIESPMKIILSFPPEDSINFSLSFQ